MKRAATFGVYMALTAFVLSFAWQLRPKPTVITVGVAPRPEARLTAQTGDGQYVEGGDCSGCKAADGEHDDDAQCVSNFCSDGSCNDCTKPEECLSNVCDVSTGVCKPPSQQDAPVCKCDINRFEGEKVYCCTSRLVDFVRFEADAYKQKVQARFAGDVPGSDYWQAQEQRWQAVRREFTNTYSVLRDAANEYPQSPSQLPGYAGKTNKEAFDTFLNASPGDSQGCPHIQCADCNVKYDSYFVYNEPLPYGSSAPSMPGSSSSVSSRSFSSVRSSASSLTQQQQSVSSAGFLVEKTLKERRFGQGFVLPVPAKGNWETDMQACTRLAKDIGNPELTCPATIERNGQTYCACTGTVASFEVSVSRNGPNTSWFHLVDVPGTSAVASWSEQKQPDLPLDACLNASGNRTGEAARCRYVPWHSEKCDGQVLPQCARQCVLNGYWQTCEPLQFTAAYTSGGWGTDVLRTTVELLEFAPCVEGSVHYNEIRLYVLPYKEALIGNVERHNAKGDLSVPCDAPQASSVSSAVGNEESSVSSDASLPVSSSAISSVSASSVDAIASSRSSVRSSRQASSVGVSRSSASQSSQHSSATPVSWVARGTLGVGNALFGSIDAATVSTFFVMLLGSAAGWWWLRRR